MKGKIQKVLRIVSSTLVILVVILAFLLHGFRLFGLEPYVVLSGSMETVYPTGSMIYVAKVEPAELEVGDVITYKMSNGTVSTHRIIELVADEDDPDIIRFRTKGDENDIVDGPLVEFDSVIGQPQFCIPLLGKLSVLITQSAGKYGIIILAVVLVAIEIAVSILPDDRDDEDKNSEENETMEKEPQL